MMHHRPGRVVTGVIFVLLGVGFLLESLGAWTLNLVFLWPLCIIALGVAVLLGRAKRLEIEETRSARLAVAEERVRIARELHDIVAHGVSLMTIQIAAARRVAGKNPQAADEALHAAENAGRQSLSELRSLLAVLRSADASIGEATRPNAVGGGGSPGGPDEAAPLTPLPHLRDIDELVEGFHNAGLRVTLETYGRVPRDVSPGVELAAYRVVQESLTNVVRHAGPRAAVRVTVEYKPDRIELEIDDDGDPSFTDPLSSGGGSEGHGLLGMRERVTAVGGTLEIGPKVIEPGWRVRASLPIASEL